jgi:hypothetical protein
MALAPLRAPAVAAIAHDAPSVSLDTLALASACFRLSAVSIGGGHASTVLQGAQAVFAACSLATLRNPPVDTAPAQHSASAVALALLRLDTVCWPNRPATTVVPSALPMNLAGRLSTALRMRLPRRGDVARLLANTATLAGLTPAGFYTRFRPDAVDIRAGHASAIFQSAEAEAGALLCCAAVQAVWGRRRQRQLTVSVNQRVNWSRAHWSSPTVRLSRRFIWRSSTRPRIRLSSRVPCHPRLGLRGNALSRHSGAVPLQAASFRPGAVRIGERPALAAARGATAESPAGHGPGAVRVRARHAPTLTHRAAADLGALLTTPAVVRPHIPSHDQRKQRRREHARPRPHPQHALQLATVPPAAEAVNSPQRASPYHRHVSDPPVGPTDTVGARGVATSRRS